MRRRPRCWQEESILLPDLVARLEDVVIVVVAAAVVVAAVVHADGGRVTLAGGRPCWICFSLNLREFYKGPPFFISSRISDC